MWAHQNIRREHARTFLSSGGLGTMGFGFPAAIGAKIGCPESEVGLRGRRRLLPDGTRRRWQPPRSTTCRSRCSSSTTARSAWSTSGRVSSTTSATRHGACRQPRLRQAGRRLRLARPPRGEAVDVDAALLRWTGRATSPTRWWRSPIDDIIGARWWPPAPPIDDIIGAPDVTLGGDSDAPSSVLVENKWRSAC